MPRPALLLFNLLLPLPLDKKNGGGRPPKYHGASRPVTITLPESTLEHLRYIDTDRGQAIVKLAEAAVTARRPETPPVEIVEMAEKTGLIVVGPCEALRRIPFVHLVEVTPARYLIALESGHDYRALELAIRDLHEENSAAKSGEGELISLLLENVRRLRKAARVTMAEILLVRLD